MVGTNSYLAEMPYIGFIEYKTYSGNLCGTTASLASVSFSTSTVERNLQIEQLNLGYSGAKNVLVKYLYSPKEICDAGGY